MSKDIISNVLLVSFDQSQDDDVKKLRGVIEEDQDIKVVNFFDIHHLYQKQPSYAKKLKSMLDRIKLCIIITPNDINTIQDEEKLLNMIKLIYSTVVDNEASKVFLDFLNIERDLDSSATKLVVVSFGGATELPEVLGNPEHVKNMFIAEGSEGESGSMTKVDRVQLKELLMKCKREGRATFLKDDDESEKKKGCMLM